MRVRHGDAEAGPVEQLAVVLAVAARDRLLRPEAEPVGDEREAAALAHVRVRELEEVRQRLGDEEAAREARLQLGLELVERVGIADGDELRRVAVELQVEGEPVQLPAAVDLSAYRIIQEGLTNALKHAHASRADVVVRYGRDEIQIDVRDDGRGVSSSDGLGHGLVGVRERVKLYGGRMSAGAVDGRGFLLSTNLPFRGKAQ